MPVPHQIFESTSYNQMFMSTSILRHLTSLFEVRFQWIQCSAYLWRHSTIFFANYSHSSIFNFGFHRNRGFDKSQVWTRTNISLLNLLCLLADGYVKFKSPSFQPQWSISGLQILSLSLHWQCTEMTYPFH